MPRSVSWDRGEQLVTLFPDGYTPIQTVCLPWWRGQPMLKHNRDLRPNLCRDMGPRCAFAKSEWLRCRSFKWCGKENHGVHMGVNHNLEGTSQSTDEMEKKHCIHPFRPQ